MNVYDEHFVFIFVCIFFNHIMHSVRIVCWRIARVYEKLVCVLLYSPTYIQGKRVEFGLLCSWVCVLYLHQNYKHLRQLARTYVIPRDNFRLKHNHRASLLFRIFVKKVSTYYYYYYYRVLYTIFTLKFNMKISSSLSFC